MLIIDASPSQLWTPANLPVGRLSFWQDAFDLSSIILQSGVSQWSDKSGNNRHFTQSVADNQPSYSSTAFFGLPGITFDGVNDSLQLAGISSQITNQTHGVYWVFHRISGNSGGSGYNPTISPKIVNNAEGGALHYVKSNNFGASYPYFYQPGASSYELFSGTQYNNTTGYVMSFQANAPSGATAWSVHRNGTLEGNTNAIDTPNTNNEGYVLAHQIGYNRYLNGVFAEVLMIQNVTGLIRNLVEGYLAWKWNLQANLPTAHPFRNRPPLISDI